MQNWKTILLATRQDDAVAYWQNGVESSNRLCTEVGKILLKILTEFSNGEPVDK